MSQSNSPVAGNSPSPTTTVGTTVYAASDHAGVHLRERLVRVLQELGATVVDLGTPTTDPVDYPDFAEKVGLAMAANPGSLGLLCCGSAVGICVAANKMPGLRAAMPYSDDTARLSRQHNDTNVICFGERTMDPALSERLLRIWWASSFEGGRHAPRVAKVNALDSAYCGPVVGASK